MGLSPVSELTEALKLRIAGVMYSKFKSCEIVYAGRKDRIVSSAICFNTHLLARKNRKQKRPGVQGDRQRVGRDGPGWGADSFILRKQVSGRRRF